MRLQMMNPGERIKPASEARRPLPRWSLLLRALRDASGVTQAGWAARLAASRATVQRWEQGQAVPDAAAEEALVSLCVERRLFRTFERGPLRSLTVSEAFLRDLLAEARAAEVSGPAPPSLPPTVARLCERARRRFGVESAEPSPAPERSAAPPTAPADGRKASLSVTTAAPLTPSVSPATSFIGRQRELRAIRRILRSTRLLTLTGGGGIGKTRLASRSAEQIAERGAVEVRSVALAPVTDPALVPAALATALGVREEPGRPLIDTLATALSGRAALLLLDNCEHLLAASAELAGTLLRLCPNLRILATSRAPLGLAGEAVYRVPPLSVQSSKFKVPGVTGAPLEPGTLNVELGQADAVRLFAERAAAVLLSFRLSGENIGVVAHICRQLDGIPLAIELAAARVRILALEQIAARLDERLRLLGGGDPAEPRHQTLRAALDWSYELLTEREQALLRRLSVFAGGCEIEAVATVCADPSPGPSPTRGGEPRQTVPAEDPGWTARRLSDRPQSGEAPLPASGRGRGRGQDVRSHPDSQLPIPPNAVFDLLTRLADKSLVVVGHAGGAARYSLLETVRQYAAERLGGAAETVLTRSRHCDWVLRLAERAAPEVRGPEQAAWLQRLELEHDNVRAALGWTLDGGQVADGLRLAGLMGAFWQPRGYLSEGRQWLERLLARANGTPIGVRALALLRAGMLAGQQGDFDQSGVFVRDSLELFRETDDHLLTAEALNQLGVLAWRRSDFAGATACHEEVLAIAREIDNPALLTKALNNLGVLAHDQGELAIARGRYQEALAMARTLGDGGGIAIRLDNLARFTITLGDLPLARTYAEEALALARQHGNMALIPTHLRRLAEIQLGQGVGNAALVSAAEALDVARAIGNQFEVAEALEHLGRIAVERDDLASARAYLRESLAIARTLDTRRQIWVAFHRLGQIARQSDDWRRAARLFAAAEAVRAATGEANAPGSGNEIEEYLTEMAAAHGDLAIAAAWNEGSEWSREQAIAYALSDDADVRAADAEQR